MAQFSNLARSAARVLFVVTLVVLCVVGSILWNLRQQRLRRENTARKLQEFSEALKLVPQQDP